MREIKMLKVEPSIVGGLFPTVEVSIVTTQVETENENGREFLDFAYNHIGCDCIDVVTFGNMYEENHFTVTVDDEGLLKSGNVVMELTLPIKYKGVQKLQLCGTLLIGHVKLFEGREDEGLYEVGLTDEQIDYVSKNLEVSIIGVTQ